MTLLQVEAISCRFGGLQEVSGRRGKFLRHSHCKQACPQGKVNQLRRLPAELSRQPSLQRLTVHSV